MHMSPFKAELYLSNQDKRYRIVDGCIRLSGDLIDSKDVYQECERIAKLAAIYGTDFIVDSQPARLHVGGENMWSEAVRKFFDKCWLVYLPSPLAQNLEYDDKYEHVNSEFLE